MLAPRRLLVVTAAVAALLLGGACSKNDATSTTGTTAGTAAAEGKKTTAVSSEELKQWQTDLNAVGCDAGPVDGIDGGETEAAIKSFQQASGLAVDGLIGAQTSAALKADVAAGKKVCGAAGTTTSTKKPSGTTTPGSTPGTTAKPSGECPGPTCISYSISPSSGAAGSIITVSAATGECTTSGEAKLLSDKGATVASAPLTAEGMNQHKASLTVPAGTAKGTYTVASYSSGTSPAGCSAKFTVT